VSGTVATVFFNRAKNLIKGMSWVSRVMTDKTLGKQWGPIVFWLTFIAVLIFFWWLLIYDHGVQSVH